MTMRIRLRLILGLLLAMATIPATAAPYPPDLSLRRYLSHTDFIPRAAQGGMSNPPIVFQNQGTPLGVSFTVNCSTGMTCSFVNGVMTMTAAGGGGFPRLDQVLDPTADKTFAMGGHKLTFADSTSGQLIGVVIDPAAASLTLDSSTGPTTGSIAASGAATAAATLGSDGSLTLQSDNTVGGSEARIFINRSVTAKWVIADNDVGADVDELTFTERTNNTYKFYVKQGTTGNMYLQPSGGNVGIGVDPAGSPAAKLEVNGTLQGDSSISGASYLTVTNCSSAASPAVCGSAAAGSVAVPTGITPTLVVNTTAVTANSQILFTPDESLGAKLGVTCNSTIAQVAIEPIVTARTAATSFTIQYNTTITANPICLSYLIIN